MPGVAAGCHELRIPDAGLTWRIVYHVAPEAVVVLGVFQKKTMATPIRECQRRLALFRRAVEVRGGGDR